METKVVRIRRSGDKIVQDCDIYIGRRITMGGWNLQESIWRNPYDVKTYGRDKCLELYEEYVTNNEELMSKLGELRGKTLGCWCKPERCHGDILVKLVEQRFK